MLALDFFQGYCTDTVKAGFVTVAGPVIILGGMTSMLQTLDVCLNKPFKAHVKQLYAMRKAVWFCFHVNWTCACEDHILH